MVGGAEATTEYHDPTRKKGPPRIGPNIDSQKGPMGRISLISLSRATVRQRDLTPKSLQIGPRSVLTLGNTSRRYLEQLFLLYVLIKVVQLPRYGHFPHFPRENSHFWLVRLVGARIKGLFEFKVHIYGAGTGVFQPKKCPKTTLDPRYRNKVAFDRLAFRNLLYFAKTGPNQRQSQDLQRDLTPKSLQIGPRSVLTLGNTSRRYLEQLFLLYVLIKVVQLPRYGHFPHFPRENSHFWLVRLVGARIKGLFEFKVHIYGAGTGVFQPKKCPKQPQTPDIETKRPLTGSLFEIIFFCEKPPLQAQTNRNSSARINPKEWELALVTKNQSQELCSTKL